MNTEQSNKANFYNRTRDLYYLINILIINYKVLIISTLVSLLLWLFIDSFLLVKSVKVEFPINTKNYENNSSILDFNNIINYVLTKDGIELFSNLTEEEKASSYYLKVLDDKEILHQFINDLGSSEYLLNEFSLKMVNSNRRSDKKTALLESADYISSFEFNVRTNEYEQKYLQITSSNIDEDLVLILTAINQINNLYLFDKKQEAEALLKRISIRYNQEIEILQNEIDTMVFKFISNNNISINHYSEQLKIARSLNIIDNIKDGMEIDGNIVINFDKTSDQDYLLGTKILEEILLLYQDRSIKNIETLDLTYSNTLKRLQDLKSKKTIRMLEKATSNLQLVNMININYSYLTTKPININTNNILVLLIILGLIFGSFFAFIRAEYSDYKDLNK